MQPVTGQLGGRWTPRIGCLFGVGSDGIEQCLFEVVRSLEEAGPPVELVPGDRDDPRRWMQVAVLETTPQVVERDVKVMQLDTRRPVRGLPAAFSSRSQRNQNP